MALTAEGRDLTQAHKEAQIDLGGLARAEALVLFDEFDPVSPEAWVAAQVALLERRKNRSGRLAEAYLAQYSAVEAPGQVVPVQAAPVDRGRLFGVVWAGGPQAVQNLVDTGVSQEMSVTEVRQRFAEIVAAETRRTGRDTIQTTSARADGIIGWRRVTDGNPCAFCAMLASRGPVYGRDTVWLTRAGNRYHKGCGCTAEPVFGHWEPTDTEQAYIDCYNEAAKQADLEGVARVAPKPGRDEDNILWRMRRINPGLFSDGIATT